MRLDKYLLLIICLSFLPLTSIFITTELIHTHDGLVHLPRMAAYYKALFDGNFPPRWAGDLNYGYGMPLFNFIYHTPYLISSLFLALKFGLVNSFKLTLVLSYIFSGVFMYLLGRAFFNDKIKGFIVAVFYQFATFRFIELLLRGSFGEIYTYTFLPLVLLFLVILTKKQEIKFVFFAAVAITFLIISHNSVSLLFFAACVLFVLFFASNKKQYIYNFASLILGLMLSAFYWIPAITDHKYTYGNEFMKELFVSHFPQFYILFIPNIMNSSALQIENISVQIGYFHVFAIAVAFYIFFTKKGIKKIEKKLILFAGIIILGSLFFMHTISKPLWGNITLLRQFQFPWRFLSLIAFSTSLLSVFLLRIPIIKKNIFIFVFLVVFSSIFYWIPQLGFDKIDESKYWNFPLTTTYYGETDIIWSEGPAKSYPKERIEIIAGEGKISNFKKGNSSHTFLLDAKTKVGIVDHTHFFPGWKVSIDGKNIPIQFQDPNHRGEITFEAPKGKNEIKVYFTETLTRFTANMISLFSFSLIIVILVLKKIKFWIFRNI